MLKNIDGVIFDLDGTLVDSMWIWKDIDIEYLGSFGHTLPADLQHLIEGMSFSETAVYFKERFKLPVSIDEIKKTWNNMASQKYENEVPLKKGVWEFIKYLKKCNIAMGIATSNSKELAKIIVNKYNLTDYISSVRTSCEALKGKPSPDIYLLVASDLDIVPERCLVFEDVLQGVIGGKNAGMKVCAVYDEFSESDYSKKAEYADYYIEDYYDKRLFTDM